MGHSGDPHSPAGQAVHGLRCAHCAMASSSAHCCLCCGQWFTVGRWEAWAALACVSSKALQATFAWLSVTPTLHGTSCHTTALQLKACSPWHCREQ